MKKLIKSKIFISVMITLAMVVTAFSGVLLLINRNKGGEILAAETTIDHPMVARKLWVAETDKKETSSENETITKQAYTLQYHGDDNKVIFDENDTTRSVVSQSSLKQELKNNEFVILNKRTGEKEGEKDEKEIILVSFNLDSLRYETTTDTNGVSTKKLVATAETGDTSYYTLQVNAYLNGRPLKTNETIKGQGTDASKYYYQLLNLNANATDPLRYSDETIVPQDDIEGKYKFVFQYSRKEGDGTVGSQETTTMEFYVFNQDTYENKIIYNTDGKIDEDKTLKLEPKLSNTEKINRFVMNANQLGGVEYNYFNFNNEKTTNYFGNRKKSSTSLLFPTINYDITKYSLRYRVSLYGTYSDYEYIFAGYDTDRNPIVPIVNVYKDGVQLSSTRSSINGVTTTSVSDQTLNDFTISDNIISIKLSNIGEYDFEFNYVYKTKDYNNATGGFVSTGYVINSTDSKGYTDENISFVKKENWEMVGDRKLYLFGYQLYYSDYSNSSVSGNLEFTNKKDKFTDVTFINDISEIITGETSTNNFVETNNLKVNYTGKADASASDYICATNQAPITLSYYAKMTLDSNKKTNSYYKYWASVKSYLKYTENNNDKEIKKANKPIQQPITNNTRFTKNGYYQVFIEYQFENYKYTTDNESNTTLNTGSETKKYQFFSFAINNSEPTISVVENTDTTAKAIPTNGFTNKDVKITWSANTEFDIMPRVSILKKNYGENVYTEIFNQESNKLGDEYGISYVNGKEITISSKNNVDTNGNYQVVIHYGPGSHTLVKYRFTIDSNEIENIKTYSISNVNKNNEITYTDEVDSNIIDTAFALDWNNKASGAEIDVQYDFIALESGNINNNDILKKLKGDTLTVENIVKLLGKNYFEHKNEKDELDPLALNLSNGYKLNAISRNIPYTKPSFTHTYDKNNVVTSTKLEDINSMRTSAGFYLFTLTDSAGNVSYKSVFVDNSKPVIYTFTNEETDFVLNENAKRKTASRDTIAIWGDNKAIAIDKKQDGDIENKAYEIIKEFLNKSQEQKFYNINENSLLISINSRTSVEASGNTQQQYPGNNKNPSINSQYQIFNIKAKNADEPKWYEGEHIHKVSIQDQGKIAQGGNKINDNTAILELEMNSDNSLLMAYLAKDNTEDELKNARLDNTSVGNGQKLYLEWIQNEGNDFEVSAITYYYFPLTFDETSPIYPYSSTPEITQNIDLLNSSISELNINKKISTAINLESDTTLEGLYVVKREYKKALNKKDDNNISGDYSPRYYAFFIDRNKVISYAPNGTLIGDQIGLNIGSNSIANYQVTYQGADFLVDTNENNSKFITSKLPIKFINTINELDKFDSQENKKVKENIDTDFKIGNDSTGLKLSKQVIHTFTLRNYDVYYKERASDAFPANTTIDSNALDFKLNGYYKIVLHDKTSKLDQNDKALDSTNDYIFIFQVKVDEPSANIVKYAQNTTSGKNEYLYYLENTISTNNDNMLVVWNKPASERGFDAEIDRQNFSIKGTLESGKEFSLDVIDGYLKVNGTTSSGTSQIVIKEVDENSNFDNPTWDYYLDFKDIFNILPKDYKTASAKYEISLHYIGGKDAYGILPYNTTKTIVFDFKKPEYNYNRLLESDIYLANYFTDKTYAEFVDNFNDYTSELNFENYAFTVTPSFTLDEMVVTSDNIWSSANMDTYKMFIRKYSKYSNDSIENQQSITPDDPRFNDVTSFPNRYRFNENYTVNNKKIYTDISPYYWNDSDHKTYTLDYILSHSEIDKEYNTYYEIIEIDYAGNYRVYTIYVKDSSDDTMQAIFTTRDENGENEKTIVKDFTFQQSYTTDNNNKVSLINAKENLSSIYNSNNWQKLFSCQLELRSLINGFAVENNTFNEQYILVTVTDITKNKTTTLSYRPNENVDEFISKINSLVNEYNYETGNIYYLTFTTSFGEYLKIEHRKPSKDYPSYTISSGPIGFDIEFNVSINNINLSSYFTNIQVFKAENGILGTSSLTFDSNGKTIVEDIEKALIEAQQDNASYKYSFKMQGSSGSEYLIVFTDNFGRQLKIRQVIGVDNNQDKIIYTANDYELLTITASDSSVKYPINLTFTNSDVTLKYQSILNSLTIYEMNAKTVDGQIVLNTANLLPIDETKITKYLNGIWTYPLITDATINNKIYKVVFTSTQGEEVYYIGYYKAISNISIIRASDGLKTEISNQQTYSFDKMIYIQVEDINPLFPTTITGQVEYIDEDGNTTFEQLGTVSNGHSFTRLGNYTFTAKNNLGTMLTFFVKIEKRISGYFWVTYKIGDIEAGQLSPIAQDKTNNESYGSLNNPYKYFTIYDYEVKTNVASKYTYEISRQDDVVINSKVVGRSTIYKVYKQVGDEFGITVEKDIRYLLVTKLETNSNFIRDYDNIFYINGQIQTNTQIKMSQDKNGNSKNAIVKLEKPYNLVKGNDIMLGYSYNGNFIKEINLANVTDDNELTFSDSGEYEFYFKDIAGNIQKFNTSNYFKMILINDVIFTVNSKQSIDNSVFNDSVSITLQNLDEFKDRRITLKALLNGQDIVVSRNRNTYIFEQYGIYSLAFEGQVVNEKGEVSNIQTNFNFRIINPNEAMSTYEYVGLNNYEIIKVLKYDTKDSEPQDITEQIKQELGIKFINTLALSTYENGLGGAGIYEITVQARYFTNKLDQHFTFMVWLNNDTDILIKCSIEFGGSTTKPITITLNKYQIYTKVGECRLMLNDNIWLEINESTASENKAETFTINQNGVFNVRLVTNSGNTLESFIITKNEPLNSVAIIVIVISIIAAGVIVFIFIKLRKNMRVK